MPKALRNDLVQCTFVGHVHGNLFGSKQLAFFPQYPSVVNCGVF